MRQATRTIARGNHHATRTEALSLAAQHMASCLVVATRIQGFELRRQTLPSGEAQMMVGPGHTLFRQNYADLLCADRNYCCGRVPTSAAPTTSLTTTRNLLDQTKAICFPRLP